MEVIILNWLEKKFHIEYQSSHKLHFEIIFYLLGITFVILAIFVSQSFSFHEMATFKNIITFPLKETLASGERILSTHGAKSLWMMGQNLWWNSNFALSDFATCLGRTNRSHLKKGVMFLCSYTSSSTCSISLLETTLNKS